MIGDYIGFVYMVTDKETGMKYIGKKGFFSKVTKPPLKGKKRKRRSLKESDWKKYCGSSEAVKLIVVRKHPDLTTESVREYCKQHLTPYKVPKHVEFCHELFVLCLCDRVSMLFLGVREFLLCAVSVKVFVGKLSDKEETGTVGCVDLICW